MMPLLPLDEAFAIIRTIKPVTGSEIHPVCPTLSGRVLSAPAMADHDVPPFKNSAVDGYALNHGRKGDVFPITQSLPAGSFAQPLTEGSAAQVFTGGMIPNNTQTIIMNEDVQLTQDGIRLSIDTQPNSHIRLAGEDFASNSPIFPIGTILDSRHVASLAVAGVQKVQVAQKLHIGIFSAGDEVTDHTNPLKIGKIHDGNRPALLAMLQPYAELTDLGIIPDNAAAMHDFMAKQQQHFDLLIGSAGMSESTTDHTAATMTKLGKILFWQLAIKPARPVGLVQFHQKDNSGKTSYFLGLPGNPASCLLAGWLIGIPLIQQLSGSIAQLPKSQWVTLGFECRKKPHRREFIRVTLNEQNIAHRLLPSGSATLSSFALADGILDIPEGENHLECGKQVRYYPFHSGSF